MTPPQPRPLRPLRRPPAVQIELALEGVVTVRFLVESDEDMQRLLLWLLRGRELPEGETPEEAA